MVHCVVQYDAPVDETAAALASAIGLRVRKHRQTRGLTLDRLAKVSGVSRRMLINVEHGVVNPSVGTLLAISDALGVGLPSLVEPPGPKSGKVMTGRSDPGIDI
jgi:transcriptional regulator with XRE-family HTH domain